MLLFRYELYSDIFYEQTPNARNKDGREGSKCCLRAPADYLPIPADRKASLFVANALAFGASQYTAA